MSLPGPAPYLWVIWKSLFLSADTKNSTNNDDIGKLLRAQHNNNNMSTKTSTWSLWMEPSWSSTDSNADDIDDKPEPADSANSRPRWTNNTNDIDRQHPYNWSNSILTTKKGFIVTRFIILGCWISIPSHSNYHNITVIYSSANWVWISSQDSQTVHFISVFLQKDSFWGSMNAQSFLNAFKWSHNKLVSGSGENLCAYTGTSIVIRAGSFVTC